MVIHSHGNILQVHLQDHCQYDYLQLHSCLLARAHFKNLHCTSLQLVHRSHWDLVCRGHMGLGVHRSNRDLVCRGHMALGVHKWCATKHQACLHSTDRQRSHALLLSWTQLLTKTDQSLEPSIYHYALGGSLSQ